MLIFESENHSSTFFFPKCIKQGLQIANSHKQQAAQRSFKHGSADTFTLIKSLILGRLIQDAPCLRRLTSLATFFANSFIFINNHYYNNDRISIALLNTFVLSIIVIITSRQLLDLSKLLRLLRQLVESCYFRKFVPIHIILIRCNITLLAYRRNYIIRITEKGALI